MTKEIILETISGVGKKGKHLLSYLKQNHPDIIDELLQRTDFLDEAYARFGESPSFRARIYCIEHDIHEPPKCQNPDCHTGRPPRWSYSKGQFKQYCCSHCCHIDWYRTDRFKSKSRETCKQKYGVEHFVQTDKFKELSRNTCLRNHGVDHISMSEEWRDGVKETCRKKYGADSPFESEQILAKARITCKARMGVENPFLSSDIQQRIEQTTIESHGGMGYASKSILRKAEATSKARYGEAHFTQTVEYHKVKKHKFKYDKYPDMSFDSSWEFKVYDYAKEHGLDVEYQPSVSFNYECDGVRHTYHPDFLIDGKLYEVKGNHFFDESGKMVNPFGHDKNALYQAKHQCMLSHGVTILKDWEIQNLDKVFIS